MTEATWIAAVIAAISAVPPTIVALATLRQSRATMAKAQEVSNKADVIHDLTNSNLTKVTDQLVVANDRIAALEQILGRMAK